MTPLCRQADSVLVCIDIQETLLSDMSEPALSRMLDSVETLLKAAGILDIPVSYTEKFPAGLGSTNQQVINALPAGALRHEQEQFSCACSEGFLEAIRSTHKRQAVLTGVEAHICVLQTALELQEDGYEVIVVDDAICSRRVAHWKSALDRLRQSGVIVAPTESILYEWLRGASQEQFRQISALLK